MAYTLGELFRPAISPWDKILPVFLLKTRSSELRCFSGIRDFVISACDSPALANRFVYPSTINMTIFRTSEPIEYSASHRYPRFIVSPFSEEQVRLRHYSAQTIQPELQSFAPLTDETHRVKIMVDRYVRGEPKPDATWILGPPDAIGMMRTQLESGSQR